MGKRKGKRNDSGVKATIATVIELLSRPLPISEFTGALTVQVTRNPLLRPINRDVKAGANVAKQQCARMKLIRIVRVGGDRFVVLNPESPTVTKYCTVGQIDQHARFLAQHS